MIRWAPAIASRHSPPPTRCSGAERALGGGPGEGGRLEPFMHVNNRLARRSWTRQRDRLRRAPLGRAPWGPTPSFQGACRRRAWRRGSQTSARRWRRRTRSRSRGARLLCSPRRRPARCPGWRMARCRRWRMARWSGWSPSWFLWMDATDSDWKLYGVFTRVLAAPRKWRAWSFLDYAREDAPTAKSPMPSGRERANMRLFTRELPSAQIMPSELPKLLEHGFSSFAKKLRIASTFAKLLELLLVHETGMRQCSSTSDQFGCTVP